MTSDLEKELKKAIEERDASRRHASRLRSMLAGAYSLLALHGVELEVSEYFQKKEQDDL